METQNNEVFPGNVQGARFYAAFAFACLIGAVTGVMLFLPSVHDGIYNAFGRVNLIIYALLCAVVILSFLFAYLVLLRKTAFTPHVCNTTFGKRLLVCAPLLLNGILLTVMFVNESVAYDAWLPRYADAFIWHKLPLPAFLLLELALFAVLLLLLKGSDGVLRVSDAGDGVAYWIAAVLMAAIVGYSMYCPNPFLNLYHVNAYYQPVLYILNGVPYGEIHNSIYGHYGLFLAPLIRILHTVGIGSYMRCFALLVAGVALVQQLLVSYTLFAACKNRFLRFVGLIASGLVLLVLRETTYQQLFPHRTFPLMLMAAAIALNMRHAGGRHRVLVLCAGWISALFALLWSTEMGIMAIAGWCCYLGIKELQTCTKGWLLRCVGIALGAVAVFLAAWGIMDLYNLFVGGNLLSLRQFVFPLMVRYYMTDRLELTLAGKISTWSVILGLLLFFVCRGLRSSRICDKSARRSSSEAMLFAVSVMLFGAYSYAINRSVYIHYGIGYELIVVLLCVLASEALPAVKRLLSGKPGEITRGQTLLAGAGMGILTVLCSLALWCAVCAGSRIEYRQALSDPSVTTELWYESKDVVRPGTKAFGFGAVEMFALSDTDNVVYNMNYMDIEIDGPAPKIYTDTLLGDAVNDPVIISRECLAMHEDWALGGYDRFMSTHTLVASWGDDESNPAFPVTLLYFEPNV